MCIRDSLTPVLISKTPLVLLRILFMNGCLLMFVVSALSSYHLFLIVPTHLSAYPSLWNYVFFLFKSTKVTLTFLPVPSILVLIKVLMVNICSPYYYPSLNLINILFWPVGSWSSVENPEFKRGSGPVSLLPYSLDHDDKWTIINDLWENSCMRGEKMQEKIVSSLMTCSLMTCNARYMKQWSL